MQIEFETDSNIEGHEALAAQVRGVVEGALHRFNEHIMRVDVHMSDENSDKKVGHDTMRCMMAAHLKGLQHIAVTHHASTLDEAVSGAADKLSRMIESHLGRWHDKERHRTDPDPSPPEPEPEKKA